MAENPYTPPTTDPARDVTTVIIYAGFWVRVAATMIDTVLIACVTFPLLLIVYGMDYFFMEGLIVGPADFFISWIMPAFVVLIFWHTRGATPGKMALKVRIVDAQTGDKASLGRLAGRYLAYFAALIPVGFGFIWVAFDQRRQGWHDKLAGTVVIREYRHHGGEIETASFPR